MTLPNPSTDEMMGLRACPPKVRVLQSGKGKWDFIREITQSGAQDEAFYVLEVDDIVRKHEEWKLVMPRVTPFYAVKCLDDRVVLETLASLGASFDCASKNEIAKVLDLGVAVDRIIYANTNKQTTHIRYAAEKDIRVMTFDSECELYKVKQHHPTAKMVLRVRCDAKEARCVLGAKFGVLPEDAPGLMELARQLEIDLVGISFHVGSGCNEPEVFDRCIVIGRKLFDLASQEYGFNMMVLDLGGGYPGFNDSLFKKIASIISDSLDRYFPEDCGVNIIAEPGRYYVASAATLVAQIITLRKVSATQDSDTDRDDDSFFYYMNDGLYGSFRVVHYGEQYTPQPVKIYSGPKHACTIWGPTCDSADHIPIRNKLPRMDVGDWLVFENMGAYTFALASSFNGFPTSTMYPIVQPPTWLRLKNMAPFTENRFDSSDELFPQDQKSISLAGQ